MFRELKPYPEYVSKAGASLLPAPAAWSRRRIKTLLREVDRRSTTGTERLLSLRSGQGLVDHLDGGGKEIAADALVGYKVVRPGDLVMNRMRAASGVFGLAGSPGLVSPDYALFRRLGAGEPDYLLALLRSVPIAAEMRRRSRGMGTGESGFLRLYTDAFGAMQVPWPSLEEQSAIVKYLGHAHARIDRAIAAKRKLIALLEEQKQAIINQAVTRGLDLTVPMKDSGAALLGDVPCHWSVGRLSTVAQRRQITGTRNAALLSVYLGRGVIPYDEGGKRVHATSLDVSNYQLVEPGYLVMNNQQAWRGSVGVSLLRGIVSPAYLVLELGGELDANYARHLFPARSMVNQYLVSSKGVGDIQRTVYWPYLSNIRVPLPPADEQRRIAEHVIAAQDDAARVANRVSRELELLREFRTRLTSDVVTGQLDVREIAARLPDFVEHAHFDADSGEDESFDELDELEEADA
jgi:type I restriction enzyme S subunit